MEKKKHIRIVAICGSLRAGNLTQKVLALVLDEIRKQDDIDLDEIYPSDVELIFPGEAENASLKTMQKKVTQAAGIILATPEYHGSYSSIIKAIIENLGYPSVLSGKPVAILGVASGQIGAVKAIEHLSSVCQHLGAIVLPGSVSVARVHQLFDTDGQCRDKAVEKRIRGLAAGLITFIRKHVCSTQGLEEQIRQENI